MKQRLLFTVFDDADTERRYRSALYRSAYRQYRFLEMLFILTNIISTVRLALAGAEDW